jgi:hypothetical protein
MKHFTVKEANDLLPLLIPKLVDIRDLYQHLDEMRESARAAAVASQFGGGMVGGTKYVSTLYDVGRLTTELQESGVELKDYSRGLIDFPSLRNGRLIMLCWQIGDGDSLVWWHEVEAGFAGRQRL